MTEKQKEFVDEYLDCKDEVVAYLKVYSNCKKSETALVSAKKILGKDEVEKYIERYENERYKNENSMIDSNCDNEIATADEILRDFTAIARGEKACDKEQFRALEVLGKTIVPNKTEQAVTVVFEGMDKLED